MQGVGRPCSSIGSSGGWSIQDFDKDRKTWRFLYLTALTLLHAGSLSRLSTGKDSLHYFEQKKSNDSRCPKKRYSK